MLCNNTDSICISPPTRMNTHTTVMQPLNYREWIQDNHEDIDNKGKLELYDCKSHQMQVRFALL